MITENWDYILKDYFTSNDWLNLKNFLKQEYQLYTIYPPKNLIFNALKLTDFKDIKVVIIGQDPYHEENQANGLSFSTYNNTQTPKSLINIFKEIYNEYKILRTNNDLSDWAQQGVLLLNSVLTVREHIPNSHINQGWELFTNLILEKISTLKQNIVFMLWGNYAKQKRQIINNNNNHLILETSHPSPFSAHYGFFGCNHFLMANKYLKEHNIKEIKWF